MDPSIMDESEFDEFVLEQAKIWKGKLKLDVLAEDMKQDCVMKLWELGKWPCEEALAAVTVKNHCLDLKRKPIYYSDVPASELADEDNPIEAVDRQRWLNQTLKQYTWEEQKAVRLKLQGCTYEDISRETGVSVSSVQRLVSTVVERLEKAWNT